MQGVDGPKIEVKNPIAINDVQRVTADVLRELREDVIKGPDAFFSRFDPSLTSDDLLKVLLDKKFQRVSLAAVAKLIRNREVMEFDMGDPVSKDDARVVINELFRDAFFHRNHFRKDGSNYFYGHLAPTMFEVLDGQRLCGKSSILGASKHDHLEDVPKFVYPDFRDVDLIDPSPYYHRLDGDVTDQELRVLISTVSMLVHGVTKIGRNDDSLTKGDKAIFLSPEEATYFKLFSAMVGNFRAGYIKLADRIHNMSTISGHEDIRDRVRITLQTEAVYLPFSRILEINDQCRKLVDHCSGVLNPDLHDEFGRCLRARMERFRDSRIRSAIQTIGEFDGAALGVEARSFGLERYIASIDKDIADIRFKDLRVNDLDPMCEVVVTVPRSSEVNDVVRRVPAVLNMEKYIVVESPMESVHGHHGRAALVSDQTSEERRKFIYRGVVIRGFSRAFGGQITVRVVDMKNDYLSQRGILAYHHSDRQPAGISAVMNEMVSAKESGGKSVDLLRLAKDKLLYQKTYFSTPNGDVVELPFGSTYLDAAAAVNEDFVIGMQSVHVSGDLLSRTYEDRDPFEPLPPVSIEDEKPVVYFETCLSRKSGKKDGGMVKADPSWLFFCKGDKAKAALKKYFTNPEAYLNSQENDYGNWSPETDRTLIANGKAFFDRVNAVMGFDMLEFMAEKSKKTTRGLHLADAKNAILYDVGRGSLDVLDRFMLFVKPAKSFTLEADLPDEPGVLTQLLPYFKNAGLSVRPVRSKNRDAHDLFRFETAYPGAQEDLGFADLLKTLVWISYKHKIRMIDGLDLKRNL